MLNISFDVDYEAEEVTIIFDDSIVLTVTRLEDDEYSYINFHKLTDDDIAIKVKRFAVSLLNAQ